MFLTKPGDDVAAPPPPSRVSDVAAGWGDAQAAHARFHLGAQDGTKTHLLALKNFILDAQRLIFLLMLQCPSVSQRSL